MKKHFIYLLCGIFTIIAAVNFAAAYINNSQSTKATTQTVDFSFDNITVLQHSKNSIPADYETLSAGNPNVSITERQMNRHDLAVFFKELKLGTCINSETLSLRLDDLRIPYSAVTIITSGNSYEDRIKMLAMSAVYTNYDADNIPHFNYYGRCLWAYTHSITVNGNTYTADALPLLTEDGINAYAGFHSDILAEYQREGSVTLIITPSSEDYYDLDKPMDFSWTDEKKAEADMLISMGYFKMMEYILNKSDESVLYSPMPFYNQGSGTWANAQFGGGTVSSEGCCPSSIAMVISYFKNERITPDIIATMYDTDEFRSINSGSYGVSMCRQAAADFDLNLMSGSGSLSAAEIEAYLKQGYKIIISVKGYDAATGTGGDFSSGFHYIVLAGLTSDGYVIVNNPGYKTDITYETAEKVASNQSGKCYAVFSLKE